MNWHSLNFCPSSSHGGLDGDDDVVGLLGGGHGNRLDRVLGVVVGGGDYDQALILSRFKSERS